MTPVELGWLAGLLEGEGTFTLLTQRDRRKARALVRLEMTDEDVVRKAHAIAGVGSVGEYHREGYKTSWWWQVARQEHVAQLLQAIHSLMGKRRAERIAECLLVAVVQ